MTIYSQLGFNEDDRKIIKFLQKCGLPEPVAQTYMAYLGQIYPHISIEDLNEYGIPALQQALEPNHSLSAVKAFVQLLASNGFLDNLTPEYIESVIRNYIFNRNLSPGEQTILEAEIPEVMSILSRKLKAYGENRRQHYLREPAQWAISKESKDSFLQALNEANLRIKLPAYSGETFFESWKIGKLLIDKLKRGVNVRILFIHPELGSLLEGRPSAQKTVEMAKRFLNEVDQEKKKHEEAGQQDFGKLEIRWIRQPGFAHFTGLLTYTKSHLQSSGSSVVRFNIHRTGIERATTGLMISSDNTIGETSLFKVLETYFDEAWKRAEPLSGIRLWLSRAVTFIMSWQGVILIAIAIAALLFVNSILATILFFVYPVFLSVLWRRYDESKKF